MMALRHRDATGGRWNGLAGEACRAGQGQMVDVALYEAVFNMMESLVPEYDVAGVVRERTGGALPGIVPPTPTPRATARAWSSPATATPSSAA